jgi:hypothetical protein
MFPEMTVDSGVIFGTKRAFELGKNTLKPTGHNFRWGPCLPVATGEKASRDFRLSVPLSGERIAIGRILISTHGESGL